MRLSSDLGLKEAGEYALELKKAERAQEQRENRAASGSRPGSRRYVKFYLHSALKIRQWRWHAIY